MKMKSLPAFLLATIICFAISGCVSTGKLAKGNEAVAKIEKFRNEKGGLPDSLSETGIVETEEGPVYYRKESESKYILWFGKELGESVVYDSETKQWK
jgi:hypothetical protein